MDDDAFQAWWRPRPLRDDRVSANDVRAAWTEATRVERERCCQIVFEQAASDNAAQRTVDAIRGKRRTND